MNVLDWTRILKDPLINYFQDNKPEKASFDCCGAPP